MLLDEADQDPEIEEIEIEVATEETDVTEADRDHEVSSTRNIVCK